MNQLSRCKPLLGTYVEIELGADLNDEQLIDISQTAFAAIEQVEALMSFHRPDSELSKINHYAARHACPVSEAMHEVLSMALKLSALSDGVFDISVAPSLVRQGSLPLARINEAQHADWTAIDLGCDSVSFKRPLLLDLGGIAKGYAVDCAMATIPEGVAASINAGGDLRLNEWQNQQVSVRLPSNPEQLVALPMMAEAMATSANYFTELVGVDAKPASVMILPASGEPVVEAYSITVFANRCMLADSLTKWAFLDPACGDKIRDLGALAVMVSSTGEITPL